MRTIVQYLSFQPRTERTFDVFLLRLAETLRERGWRTVHVFTGEPAEPFRARLRELDSPYYLSRSPLDWSSARSLARLLRPHRPLLLQTTFMSPFDPPLLWLKRSIGAKHWIVADQSSGAGSHKTGIKRVVAKARGAVVGSMIDRLVAVSGYVAERDVERNMQPRDKVRIIHNGVDLKRFTPGPDRPTADAPFTIVFVGQLIPEKGLDVLLDAVRLLTAKTAGEVRVKVAGAGRLRDELERTAAASLPGRVEFLGQVDDVPALFRSADVAVFPSRWEEAFGLVAIEAMACGAPIITSDAGGLPEVVGSDGQVGLIFPNGDAGALADRLLELLNDPARRLRIRSAARLRAEREFSLEKMIAGYVSLYEELAPAAGSSSKIASVSRPTSMNV